MDTRRTCEESGEMKPKFRRRLWLIDREIQVGMGVRLALCLAGYMALFMAFSLIDPVTTILSSDGTVTQREAAVGSIREFLSDSLAPLLIATACMILHSVLMLHRVAGPVLRFRRGFESFRGRDLTNPIQLRTGDMLGTLAAVHNEALETLRTDFVRLRQSSEAALDLLEQDAEPPVEELRKHLSTIGGIAGAYNMERFVPLPAEDAPVEVRTPQR
jgi:methyl-accepting chemotaxis protein